MRTFKNCVVSVIRGTTARVLPVKRQTHFKYKSFLRVYSLPISICYILLQCSIVFRYDETVSFFSTHY